MRRIIIFHSKETPPRMVRINSENSSSNHFPHSHWLELHLIMCWENMDGVPYLLETCGPESLYYVSSKHWRWVEIQFKYLASQDAHIHATIISKIHRIMMAKCLMVDKVRQPHVINHPSQYILRRKKHKSYTSLRVQSTLSPCSYVYIQLICIHNYNVIVDAK